MNVVTYLDNDSLNKSDTGGASVYAVSTGKQPVTQTELIELYLQVFKEGEYQQAPVQHPPRKVPVALRDRLKSTLEDLENQDILTSVTEPTPPHG